VSLNYNAVHCLLAGGRRVLSSHSYIVDDSRRTELGITVSSILSLPTYRGRDSNLLTCNICMHLIETNRCRSSGCNLRKPCLVVLQGSRVPLPRTAYRRRVVAQGSIVLLQTPCHTSGNVQAHAVRCTLRVRRKNPLNTITL
jgi:hypothetical protein